MRRTNKLSEEDMNVIKTFHNMDTAVNTTSIGTPVVPGRMSYPAYLSFTARCTPVTLSIFYPGVGYCKIRDAKPCSVKGFMKALLEREGAMSWEDIPMTTEIKIGPQ
jgi:hypothetical protein